MHLVEGLVNHFGGRSFSLMEPKPLAMVVVVLKEWADQGGALGFIRMYIKGGS